MTASPQRRLLDVVGSRLASMTTDNGYAFTLRKLTRATLQPFSSDDLPACNYWPGTDAFLSAGAGFKERELQLVVEYHTKTRDTPFADIVFELAQDVLIALTRSAGAPLVEDPHEPTLGGLAQSITLSSTTPQLGEGQKPWCGALMTFAIRYRLKASDPTEFV